jgi:hypothetical protein
MAPEDDEDLYNEEFDFVDDEEDEVDEESDVADRADEEAADDRRSEHWMIAGRRIRPAPKPDYVVHIYEYQKLKRTIDRPFTPEDAEAFATEYNRTSKSYGFAVTGKNDAKPKKTLD